MYLGLDNNQAISDEKHEEILIVFYLLIKNERRMSFWFSQITALLKKRAALKIAMIYAIFSILWILFSDQILYALVKDASLLTKLQMFKGWFFVSVTALLIYYLLKKEIRRYQQTERKLKDSEEKFRSLVETSSDWIWEVDAEGTYTYVSPKVKELLGYEPEEIIGKKPFELMPQKESEVIAIKFQDMVNNPRAFTSLENINYHKDGREVTIETSAIPIYDDSGGLKGYRGIDRDVTNRKKAELDLRESEERFRAQYDSFPLPVYTCESIDDDFVIISVNLTASKEIDDIKSIYNKKASEIWHDEPDLMNLLRRCYIEKKTLQTEKKYTSELNGETKHLSITFAYVPTKYVLVYTEDITTRKSMEQELQDSQGRVQALLDASFEAMFLSDKGICLDQNLTAEKMFGYTSSEAIGQPGTDWIAPDDREMVKNNMLSGYEEPYETMAMRKDGSIFPAIIQGRMIDYLGRKMRVTSMRDISARKKVEKSFKIERDKAQNYLNMAGTMLVALDANQNISLINKKGCEILGYSEQELIGKNWFDTTISIENREQKRDTFKRIIAGEIEAVEKYVSSVITYKGKERLISWQIQIIENESGNIIGSFGSGEDITEREQAEIAKQEHVHFLESLEKVDRIIQRTTDSETMLNEILESTLNMFGADRAFLLYPCNPEAEYLTIAMEKTRSEYPGAFETKTNIPMNPVFPNMFNNLLDSDSPLDWQWIPGKCIWDPENRFGVQSMIVMAIHPKVDEPWLFGMHQCSHMRKWTDYEQRLFQEISNRVTDALGSLIMLRELKRSEENLRAMLDGIQDAIFLHTSNGKILQVNRQLINLYKVSPEKSLEYSIADDYSGPEAPIELLPQIWEKVINGQPQSFEWQARRPQDGSLFPVDLFLRKIFIQGEEVIIACVRDISERKQADEKLRESREMYRALSENSTDLIMRFDRDLRHVYVNSALENHLLVSADSFIGKTHTELGFPEELIKMWEDNINSVFKTGKPNKVQFTMNVKGTDKIFDWHLIPEFSADGKVETVMSTSRDITETVRLQEFADRAQRLETAGKIAGQVAHDFNNLLGPLVAYPELIKDELDENHPSLKFIEYMETAAKQMADINQQLLTLARRGHYNLKPLNLNRIIADVLMHMQSKPETLIIETDFCSDLMNMKGGSSQIFRAISNLVVNAIDAMQGIGQLIIKTENTYIDNISGEFGQIPKSEYIRLTISDSGCGIPQEILLKVFDPFFTTKSTDKRRGSGLGLSVVHGVVKDHDGYIDVRSEEGIGTTFYLYFPITREVDNVEQKSTSIGGTESLLIVDDDPVQRDVELTLLKRLGYDVETADSGEHAVEIVKNKTFDLLLLDMVMPGGIDGAETMKLITEIHPNQKAIIVSGFAESDRVAEAIRLGAGTFIKKPLTIETIDHAIRSELDKK
jgi:PAS domain S-box-containing protein